MNVLGKYNRKKDGKGRIFLPKPLRNHFLSMGVRELTCVIFDTHVCYYTKDGWRNYKANIPALIPDKSIRDKVIQSAQAMPLQKAGRVLIPKDCPLSGDDVKGLTIEFFTDYFSVARAEKEVIAETLDKGQMALPFGSDTNNISLAAVDSKKPSKSRSVQPLKEIPLSDINSNDRTFQCRLNVQVDDLVASIKEHGQQVPVILRGRKPYTIISGFRRITAVAKLGDRGVIAVVYPDLDDRKAYAVSLIENVQRKSLTDYEMIRALFFMKDKGYSTLELANLLGKGRRIVEQYLRVWQGPSEIREALRDGRISISAAINAVGKNLTVEQVEGKSIREITQELDKTDGAYRGPIYFREFGTGRITLKMQFDKKHHDIRQVIHELEAILSDLREKREDLLPDPEDEGGNNSESNNDTDKQFSTEPR